MPTFQIPGVPGYRGETVQAYAPLQPIIKVTAAEADNAAAPSRALATLWTQDPRAEPAALMAIDTQAEDTPAANEPEIDTEHGADHADA